MRAARKSAMKKYVEGGVLTAIQRAENFLRGPAGESLPASRMNRLKFSLSFPGRGRRHLARRFDRDSAEIRRADDLQIFHVR